MENLWQQCPCKTCSTICCGVEQLGLHGIPDAIEEFNYPNSTFRHRSSMLKGGELNGSL